MPAGDYDPTTVRVRFDESAAIYYPGTTVVRALRVKYAIIFPSGGVKEEALEIPPPPAALGAISAGAQMVAAAVFAYEGLTTVYVPEPPAPLPQPPVTLQVDSSEIAVSSEDVELT